MKYLIALIVSAAALLGVSCIENDIPLPKVDLNIEKIQGEGFTVASIDAANRIVTLKLDEGTDIRKVRIDQVSFSVGANNSGFSDEELLAQIVPSRELVGSFDLRTPIYVTLTLYQQCEWAIRAEQSYELRFSVAGQVGSSEIDPEAKTATAYLAKGADLSSVIVNELKLGPDGITEYSPTLAELSGSSFETVRFVDVKAHGITERWYLTVKHTEASIKLVAADAWSRVIWLKGEGIAGVTPMGFRYKKDGDAEWSELVDAKDITIDGGSFSGALSAEPSTKYLIKAFCGEEESAEMSATTGTVDLLVNGGFEAWCTIKDIVYPYLESGPYYWGTGNKGAAVASTTLTDKDAPRPGSTGQYSAGLRSKFANIAGIGKFAAGNLFIGEYVRNAGTNGIITFGRPFTQRPTALRIWVKYNQGAIDKIKGKPVGTEINIGDPDNGHIWIALGTWMPNDPSDPNNTAKGYGWDSEGKLVGTADSPLCIDTRDTNTLFDANSKDVVGYGSQIFTASTDGWQMIDIPIDYKATNIAPTHLMIVCTASRWGDYFTGSTKSEMWVDDFELIYDKPETAQ